jgi:hypothetical protein
MSPQAFTFWNFVQESLPELIGHFDGTAQEVHRRSLDLSTMQKLADNDESSRAEQAAVGELESHLMWVGVSMRVHLASIFEELNTWPERIRGLLIQKDEEADDDDEQGIVEEAAAVLEDQVSACQIDEGASPLVM